jgi:inhibitor of KinA sporulation pathway (predicted exonuclease)
MPNTNPQAVFISNTKIRPLADRFGQVYNLAKSIQAEAAAENWGSLFAGGAGNTIMDGSETDGRTQITDADVVSINTFVTAYVTFMEQASNANRNLILKVAVNPERV